jgi:hypothetical protein
MASSFEAAVRWPDVSAGENQIGPLSSKVVSRPGSRNRLGHSDPENKVQLCVRLKMSLQSQRCQTTMPDHNAFVKSTFMKGKMLMTGLGLTRFVHPTCLSATTARLPSRRN